MNVYHYSNVNGEYTGTSSARRDPLESEIQGKDVFLCPADATFVPVPDAIVGFARVWNGEGWEYIEDHRGVTVWRTYTENMVIRELGAIPEGWSETRPEPPEMKEIHVYSKFYIWVATREMPLTLDDGTETTVWNAFEAFLVKAQLLAGWNQLVDLVEDNPFFEQFYPVACDTFGKELVDSILEKSVSSTYFVEVKK